MAETNHADCTRDTAVHGQQAENGAMDAQRNTRMFHNLLKAESLPHVYFHDKVIFLCSPSCLWKNSVQRPEASLNMHLL